MNTNPAHAPAGPGGGQFISPTHPEPDFTLAAPPPAPMGAPVYPGAVDHLDADLTVDFNLGPKTYLADGTRVSADTVAGVCAGRQSEAPFDLQVVRHDDGTLAAYPPHHLQRDTSGALWQDHPGRGALSRTADRNGHTLSVTRAVDGSHATWTITTADGHRIIGHDDTATEACATATQFSDEFAAAQARAVVSPDEADHPADDPDACLRDMLGGADPDSFTPPF